LVRPLGSPLAVRSSAVDEDGAEASFAGQHMTLLNVPGVDGVKDALREIWWSANSDSAITYRQRVGLFRQPSVGVVIQLLLDPDRDIEWASAGGQLYLLQCRAITRTGGQEAQSSGAPVDVVRGVHLFSELDRKETTAIAGLFKKRAFPKGETVIKEGSGGAAF